MSPVVAEKVSKHFRQGSATVRALDGISLEVQPGQFLAIMGASGSGKSTLLHLLAGLSKPDEGHIRIAGTDLAAMNDRRLTLFRRRQIGLVFQAFNLIPTLTARQNIALPLMLERRRRRRQLDVEAKVDELIDRLGIGPRRDHRPDALSGGEQQRVAIGRALVSDPAVVLADEPTGNLDSANSKGVCELLRDLSLIHGKTIIMVTHEPAVASYAAEVAVLRDGRLIERFATQGPENGHGLAQRYAELVGK